MPGTPGHGIRLDSADAARCCNERPVNACIRAQAVLVPPGGSRLTVAIVGGAAAGVELAAHQQAMDLAKALPRLLAGKTVAPCRFEDKGSVVAVGIFAWWQP